MGSVATERMLAVVENARREARSAESDYEAMETRIQMKSSYSINLYGGTATNQVVEIASMARKACDDLYASYQMLVRMIDEECRPLLDQDPELRAVKEVKDLIVWLNDESEIEANFSASFNYNSLGNVASSKYVPTMENKMIQKYWENKYNLWPGRAEQEQKEREEAERRRKEAAEKAAAEAEKQRKQYEELMAVYEKEYAEVKEKHDSLLKAQLVKEKVKLEGDALKERDTVMERATLLKEKSVQVKTEAEQKLASLGLFKFAEKKEVRAKIEKAVADIAQAEKALADAPANYEKAMSAIPNKLNDLESNLRKDMEKKYPFPKKPVKSMALRMGELKAGGATAVQIANEGIKAEMMEMFESNPHTLYTITDIMQECPAAADLSNQRVSALVRQLVTDGLVERLEERRLAYFRYAGE